MDDRLFKAILNIEEEPALMLGTLGGLFLWLCSGIRQSTRKASFSEKRRLVSLRRCGHTTGRGFWDGQGTGSIAWRLTSMARS